jgi:hypothetical protein
MHNSLGKLLEGMVNLNQALLEMRAPRCCNLQYSSTSKAIRKQTSTHSYQIEHIFFVCVKSNLMLQGAVVIDINSIKNLLSFIKIQHR